MSSRLKDFDGMGRRPEGADIRQVPVTEGEVNYVREQIVPVVPDGTGKQQDIPKSTVPPLDGIVIPDGDHDRIMEIVRKYIPLEPESPKDKPQ